MEAGPQSLFGRMLGACVVLAAACWLCVYPVLLVAAGLVLLILVPQGNELLEATARHDQLGFKLIFHLSVAAWALSAWYCSRVLLTRRYHGRFASTSLESGDAFTVWLRIWLPRLLGAAIYALLAAWLFFAARERLEGLVVLGIGVVYWVFVVYRRMVLRTAQPAALRQDALGRATTLILLVSLLLTFILLAGFLLSPVELPRRLGAAPIILLAFASWILTGSIVFVLLPKAYELPSLALLPIVLALAAGGVDNHELRQLPPAAGADRAPSIRAAALEWLQRHEAAFRQARSEGREWFPVYITAAEGGGLRAAYWTANVLGELEAASEGRFSQRLFAVSGVSGGSLGGAAFVAELGPHVACTAPQPVNVRNCVRHLLQGDFLSPVVAYLLFPDLLQRFIPFFPIRSFDRGRALELSWEASWAEVHPTAAVNPFAAPYEAITGPRLFLNGTRVETGKRVLVSPARFDEDELPEVDDLFAVGGRRWSVPLSTAVHLSARFTYVSPPGKICKDAGETCDLDGVWGRVVDGGYHENSGAQTAAGLLYALRRAAREFEAAQPPGRTRIQPQVLIITNDPGSARLCDPAREIAPSRWYAELFSPLDALWNARTARGGQARRALADAAAGFRRDPLDKDCAADGSRENTLEFSLSGTDERPPALGWFLGVGSTTRMDKALCREDHLRAYAAVRRDLGVSAPYECRPA
ncbi:MAG: hypothetical protein ACT4P3_21875 [Betaproteobacteria bacterium]